MSVPGVPILTALPMGGLFFLAASVLCSVALGALLKVNDRRGGDRMVVISANYLVAAGASWWAVAGQGPVSPPPVTWGLGVAGGALFIGTFLLMAAGIRQAGLALTIAVNRLSLVVPVLVSLVFFGERPGWVWGAGMAAALAALGFSCREVGRSEGAGVKGRPGWRSWIVLSGLFLAMGGVGVVLKSAAEIHRGDPARQALFLALNFTVALLLGWGAVACRRIPVKPADVGFGLVLGVPNVMATTFLLRALRDVPATVAYPAKDLAVILLSALLGMAVWRERPGWRGRLALVLALLAVVLVYLPVGGGR